MSLKYHILIGLWPGVRVRQLEVALEVHWQVIFSRFTSIVQMSFGRPPSMNVGLKPGPPDRGSFPLDHFGLNSDPKSLSSVGNIILLGECKRTMQIYMACLREHAGTSTPCRTLAKGYLDCRMSKYVCLFSRLLKMCC